MRSNIYRVDQFEKAFAEKFKVKYAHAVSSGSSALKIALKALDVGSGDEVITQSHTFIATVESIVECGATPVISDIDKTLNMDPESMTELISDRTKVIIPVHMSGVACKMNEIMRLSYNCGIKVLEDNAQSIGGSFYDYRYKRSYLGTMGNIGIFSFDGGKMMTTGEGGMIVTNSKELYEKCRAISDHGHAYNPLLPRGEDDVLCLGFNHKMTEMQGAIGMVQLNKLDSVIASHRRNKMKIINGIKDVVELREIPNPSGDIGDSVSFFLPTEKQTQEFVIRWKATGNTTKNIPDAMKWHFAKYWKHIPFKSKGLDKSELILNRTVSIPVYVNMPEENIKNMVSSVREIVESI